MEAFMIRQDYDPGQTYKARKYMTIGDRAFHPGDDVPRGLVSQQAYARMFALNKLRISYDTDTLHKGQGSPQTGEVFRRSSPTEETGKASVAKAVQSTVENIAGVSSEPLLVSGYRHIGRGWYEVAHNGESKKVRTEDAAAALYATWAGYPVPAASFPATEQPAQKPESILDLARDAREAVEDRMGIQSGDDEDEDEDGEEFGPAHGNTVD
jgi:hypothetical protein